jgi:hypothetical protein
MAVDYLLQEDGSRLVPEDASGFMHPGGRGRG